MRLPVTDSASLYAFPRSESIKMDLASFNYSRFLCSLMSHFLTHIIVQRSL